MATQSADDSSPNRVVNAISRGIETGRYAPGQRLIEADLTRELGVSRGPVREGLKRLAGEGVISITRHRGAYVRIRSRKEVEDTFRVLEVLTALAARIAAEKINKNKNIAADIKVLHEKLESFRDARETQDFFKVRRQFWDAVLAAADNGEVARLMPQIQITLLRVQFQSFVTPAQFERQFEEYGEISSAILAGDAARAERAARVHLRRRRYSLAALPDEAFAADSSSAG